MEWKSGIARPTTTAQFKMEDVCNLYNVIDFFYQRKVTKIERGRPSIPFKLQMALAQLCKNTFACLCKHPHTSILKGRNRLAECQLQ
jgi:hypothetical protein